MSRHNPTSDLATLLQHPGDIPLGVRLRLIASLSWPAIMAQLSSILMEYIDASMVGSLGAAASASIGLVATTTWLFWGLGGALSTGFSVQVAHLVGASHDEQARSVLVQSIACVVALGIVTGAIGAGISGMLPAWIGGNAEINPWASSYFCIVSLSLPVCYLAFLASSMLRCAGNMLVPGMLNVAMCVLDVAFNYFLIYDSHPVLGIMVPGAGLGVKGAALGSALAAAVTAVALLWFIFAKSDHLHFRSRKLRLGFSKDILWRALKISAPIGVERIVMCGAQIVTTIIVAPIGTAAIAANAFGITAESLCYMPGYGISDAATTLVGQSVGAGRPRLAHSFGKITIGLGIAIMTVMGVVMWICAPLMMQLFTPDLQVRALGVSALRIEAWAEPMFAAAIVAYGVMVGAGYTLVPACVNLGSMWVVRITLAALLAPSMGLNGVWLAMCIELCVRGMVFLWIFSRKRWVKKANVMPQPEIEEIIQNPTPYEL